ncbi:hypothetical protein [Niveispirillum fermenti]|uniref:hypothetical protein n=1 Tax=Niveispirillum fermenti TaxID=1233113 RepID=UPI003A87CCC4
MSLRDPARTPQATEPAYDYKTTKEGDKIIMDVFVKKSRRGKIFLSLIFLIILPIVVASTASPYSGLAFISAIMPFVGVFYIIWLLFKRGGHIATTRIEINAQRISIPQAEKLFDVDHVRAIGWGLTTPPKGTPSAAFYGSGAAGAFAAGTQNASQIANADFVRQYGYCIYLIYGSRRETLVSGLHEDLVETIYDEFATNLKACGHSFG